MARIFQFAVLVLGLSLVALASAIVTMRFAIHGAEIVVPSFKGMTAEQALSKAESMGVEMTIDNRFYSAEVPAGRILTQSPAPGAIVRREWHIRAVESLGPQQVAIPNLIGQPQRAATIELRRLQLEPGPVAQMPYELAPPEVVIAQDPAPGAAGVERPVVNLVVSSEATPATAAFVMPNFVGQQYATVAVTIAHAGLKVVPSIADQKTEPLQNQLPPQPGIIAAQSPAAGYSIDANAAIQLTVTR